MTRLLFLCCSFLFISSVVMGQNTRNLERTLQPKWKMQIYDKESPVKAKTLLYNDIPKTFDFRGTVMESISWKDKEGEKILILTTTGYFPYRDLSQKGFGQYSSGTKGEIYMYMFTNKDDDNGYVMTMKMYDVVPCGEGSPAPYIGYVPMGTVVTDLDNDGVTEVIVSYVTSCNDGEKGEYDLKVMLFNGEENILAKGAFIPSEGKVDKPVVEKADKTKKVFSKSVEEGWKKIANSFK
ncbi:hypothetical protein HX057_02765 [Myroides odoratimimus]|uniref:M949_RS01915 family surface polysaccharide biosynthesis protein n=1 Tax=Myroides TaxID=76831 RepID=UPI000280A314|nr:MULTISPECIES: hypothetical protein [Myroides]APA92032.1 hypothetical protein BK054_07320 [Myroides sp. ZB35]EKB03889.1 hypothetical protein HMPREF9711_02074 [Myroides odoratimimus CCUG 3837]MCS7471953.1 hypothetical protein [Myroides odoratimimus]MDM1038687.1 hypothetical protein [Myroides odoratimimus]MDM1052871.1 hypothetical protein [Myroides odoratimimus]